MNSLQQNKETPIDALPSDNNFQNNEKEDNELVNNILKEIQEESVDNNEMQALSYQMDNQVKMEQPNINLDNQIPSGETMQQFDDLSDTVTVEEQPLYQKIIDELKNPLVVTLIVFLLSLPMTSEFITKYVPKTADIVTNNINMLGLLLKSIIAGLLYYGLKHFL